ncbi:MAG: sensor histidine kinase [Bacteroidales bacterium]|nr:sensor histidine kinase [Bacteroidales bacterium]
MKRSSLTEKMILYFLALGIGSIAVTGSFSFFSARKALLERTYDQLTSLRKARQYMVERFFTDRLLETDIYASTDEIVRLAKKQISKKNDGNIGLPEVKKRLVPVTGYYSGYMILDTSGKVIFIEQHETSEVFSDSEILIQPGLKSSNESFMIDYGAGGPYPANHLLSVCPVKVNGNVIAYLAMMIKPGQLDNFMLEVDPGNGLGYSGETYLAGSDYLMRSQSRFIHNSVMKTHVMTTPVSRALKNEQGVMQAYDYRGIVVLSSFGRIKTEGLNWAIVAELDYEEATASIYSIRNNILLLTVFTALLFFIITYIISSRITKPIKKLKKAAVELGEGRLSSLVGIESDDEIGELAEAFNSMAVILHEKDEALKAERISRLKSAIDGQDQERQRLSRELHDGIGQSMIAIRLRLAAIETGLPEKLKQNYQSVISLTDSLIDEVRAISNALMPPALAEFGLMPAIRNLCYNLTETNGIKTVLDGEIPAQVLGRKARLYIFRILQESLNNAAKHAEATEITISAKAENHLLSISITDNGKGFDQQSSCVLKGHGLNNIRERASLLKGEASILSIQGEGTTVKIEIPINKTTP